ncbi:MAG: hypothetical protein NTY53_21985, partial [Kiritimatiellaeota bacterium]|nr:hypothetical protein [Kiritimatiellota bacterium]
KHYQWYYSTREANDNMWHCPQGVHDFLRAYYHYKSADWPQNKPFPLKAWTASELAKMPTYYIMEQDKGMAESVAPFMPSASDSQRLCVEQTLHFRVWIQLAHTLASHYSDAADELAAPALLAGFNQAHDSVAKHPRQLTGCRLEIRRAETRQLHGFGNRFLREAFNDSVGRRLCGLLCGCGRASGRGCGLHVVSTRILLFPVLFGHTNYFQCRQNQRTASGAGPATATEGSVCGLLVARFA